MLIFQIGSGYLNHVLAVFTRIGFVRIENPPREWDVLWAHDYPFGGKYDSVIKNLEPHQKVNGTIQYNTISNN